MKKVFAVVMAFVLVLFVFTFHKIRQGDAGIEGTAVHSENVTGTKVYSFSGSDDILTVMNGTMVLGEDEEIFSGGKLHINSESFFEGITSYTTTFYTLKNGEKQILMTNSLIDQTGGMVVFDGDDLGKISGADIIGDEENDGTADLMKSLFFEISIVTADGENKTHQLLMDVVEIN